MAYNFCQASKADFIFLIWKYHTNNKGYSIYIKPKSWRSINYFAINNFLVLSKIENWKAFGSTGFIATQNYLGTSSTPLNPLRYATDNAVIKNGIYG